jgi:uncharacterized protein YndB with AHSA1/START domain
MEPIRLSTTVHRPAAEAFRLFTDGIGAWWPSNRGYSFGGSRLKEVCLEPVAGGRFFERYTDGEEFEVGRVLACEPPKRIVFTWQGRWPEPTEVEVRFTSVGSATRIDLEHRGWERLGASAEQSRSAYLNGWPTVLQQYVERGASPTAPGSGR